MYIQRLCIIFFCFCCFESFSLFATDRGVLEAVLVVDTRSDLREGLLHNKQKMKDILIACARILRMKVKVHTLKEENVTSQSIDMLLQAIESRPHDILFFYFSGHGIATSMSCWPTCVLSLTNEKYPMNRVFQSIARAKARLKIVLTDCCNSWPEYSFSYFFSHQTSWIAQQGKCIESNKRVEEALMQPKMAIRHTRNLLRCAHGSVFATAASTGEMAVLHPKIGSVFTIAFLDSLIESCRTKGGSWYTLVDSTIRLSSPAQTPYFLVDIKY